MFALNSSLKDVNFVTLRFHCLVNENVDLSWSIIYRLRKDIAFIINNLKFKDNAFIKTILQDNVRQNDDSLCPIVFDFSQDFFGLKSAGDEIYFDLRIFGHGSIEIEQMIELVRSLILIQWSKIIPIELQFIAVVGVDGTDSFKLKTGALNNQPLVFQEFEWCCDRIKNENNRVILCFTIPTRLQSGVKAPYFDPEWRQIAPFIVKRVVSVLSQFSVAICPHEIELATETLINLESVRKKLVWIDVVQKNRHPYGGFVGEIELEGDCLDDVHSWLVAGSILHLGKGASFGTGTYLLLDP